MTTLGDYTSLLEIGFGVGIGLSAFRAPIDLRLLRLKQLLAEEKALVRRPKTDLATAKRDALVLFELAINRAGRNLRKAVSVPILAVATGAIVNLALLIFSCINSDTEASTMMKIIILNASVSYYVFMLGLFEYLARAKLSSLIISLRTLSEAGRVEDVSGPKL